MQSIAFADSGVEPLFDEDRQIDLRLLPDGRLASSTGHSSRPAEPDPTASDLVRLASRIYDARRAREQVLSPNLLGEPAWDMLLALYCLPSRGVALGVTSLAHAANVRSTTGHRWHRMLLDRGLIVRAPHCSDARQQLVELSESGRMLMDRYLVRLYWCEAGIATDTDQRPMPRPLQ